MTERKKGKKNKQNKQWSTKHYPDN